MQKQSKKENRNTRALFSVICLCIISLGLIVYFSTNSRTPDNPVDHPTTIRETTDVQHAVTVTQTALTTTVPTTKAKPTTTQPVTMEQTDTNTPFKSYYKYPLTETVVRGYSEELTYDATMGDYRAHAAVDFGGEVGDKVVAVNDGLVLSVTNDSMYGMTVEIDHGGTFIVRYCGLKSVSVKKGKFVTIGQSIGTLGTVPCESDLAPHLHLEAKYDAKRVNPLNAMSKTE